MNLFIKNKEKETCLLARIINTAVVLVVLFLLINIALNSIGVSLDFMSLLSYHQRIIDGFLMTLYISVGSLIISLIIGILIVLMKESKVIVVNSFANLYVDLIRGTPLISQIYLFYYIAGTALGITDRVFAGIIILSIFEGAYIAEIIRGSFLSLDKQQLQIAKAIGLSKPQTLRYVILPQLVARTLPSLTGQFASTIKDSSLLSLIAVIDLTHTMREITATNFDVFTVYFVLAGLYLVFTLPISYVTKRLERRFNYAYKA